MLRTWHRPCRAASYFGVGIVVTVPFGPMTVLVPLPFGTTMLPLPVGPFIVLNPSRGWLCSLRIRL